MADMKVSLEQSDERVIRNTTIKDKQCAAIADMKENPSMLEKLL